MYTNNNNQTMEDKMIYQNSTKIEMNKEVTRIVKLFRADEYKHLISQKEETLLVARILELESRLNTKICIPGIHNQNGGF